MTPTGSPDAGIRRAAFFGGVYNNGPALLAAIQDARRRGAEALYCLGDLGGFGPHPARIHMASLSQSKETFHSILTQFHF